MKIKEILDETCIVPELKATTKEEVIAELSELFATHYPSLDKKNIVKTLTDREKLGSTGIGNGVAIPHGKLSSLDRIIVGFGRSNKGISFATQDSKPAFLFFTLVAPENTTSMHLKALARLSRMLKDSTFRSQLMTAKTSQDIYNTIITEDEKF